MATEQRRAFAGRTRVMGRIDLPALVAGLLLLLVGNLLGLVAALWGPRHTGELRLDNAFARHRDALESGVAQAVHIGFGPMIAPLVLLAVCVVAWRIRRSAAVLVAALTVVGWFSVAMGKLLFHRQRPPARVVHALVHEFGADSFPSGHTAFAAALACALIVALHRCGRRIRLAVVAGIVFVAAVAASRLVAGAHYYLDVLAAPAFAVGSVLVLCAIGAPLWPQIESRLDRRLTPGEPSAP